MKFKTVLALLTLSVALTSCNMSFSTNGTQVPDVATVITEEMGNKLSNIIENTDFKNDIDLERLAEEVTGWANEFAEDSEYLNEFQHATLVRVVDGDTIVVDIEGSEYTVRLIGVNTPESVHPDSYKNTAEGVAASEYTKKLLANVETVYLEKDTSETDPYGRILRYVWLELPENKENINEIATKMLNGILLLDKVAEPATYEPDTAYEEDFDYIYDNM